MSNRNDIWNKLQQELEKEKAEIEALKAAIDIHKSRLDTLNEVAKFIQKCDYDDNVGLRHPNPFHGDEYKCVTQPSANECSTDKQNHVITNSDIIVEFKGSPLFAKKKFLELFVKCLMSPEFFNLKVFTLNDDNKVIITSY